MTIFILGKATVLTLGAYGHYLEATVNGLRNTPVKGIQGNGNGGVWR